MPRDCGFVAFTSVLAGYGIGANVNAPKAPLLLGSRRIRLRKTRWRLPTRPDSHLGEL